MDVETIEEFNRFRRKRNTIEYERSGAVSEIEVQEMMRLAGKLHELFENLIRENHPELIDR